MTPEQEAHVLSMKEELRTEINRSKTRKSVKGPNGETHADELRWEIYAFTANCNGEEVVDFWHWEGRKNR